MREKKNVALCRPDRGRRTTVSKPVLFVLLLAVLSAPVLWGASDSESAGYLGIGFSVDFESGLMTIEHVDAEGPAKRAGLRVGDQILSLSGEELRFFSHRGAVDYLAGRAKAAVPLELTVRRGGTLRSLRVVPSERPDDLEQKNAAVLYCLDAPLREKASGGLP